MPETTTTITAIEVDAEQPSTTTYTGAASNDEDDVDNNGSFKTKNFKRKGIIITSVVIILIVASTIAIIVKLASGKRGDSTQSLPTLMESCRYGDPEPKPDADCPYPFGDCCNEDCCIDEYQECIEYDWRDDFFYDCTYDCSSYPISPCREVCPTTSKNCLSKRYDCLEAVPYAYTGGRVYEWESIGYLTDYDGEEEDYFGSVVALSGDGRTIAVVSQRPSTGTSFVRVFRSNCTAWGQLGSDIDDGLPTDDINQDTEIILAHKRLAISRNGNTVAVGSPEYNAVTSDGMEDSNEGTVRVYDLVNGEWQARTPIVGTSQQDGEGVAVSLSADGMTLATSTSTFNFKQGRVSIYKWNGLVWDQMGDPLFGTEAESYFGHALDLSADGRVLIVGAPGTWKSKNGTVSVYRYLEGAGWNMIGGKLGDFDDNNKGNYPAQENGFSVAISSDGSTIAMGAPGRLVARNQGVRVFRLSENDEWLRLGGLITVGPTGSGNVDTGMAVDLSSDGETLAAIAQIGHTGTGGDGDVFKYSTETENWEKTSPGREGIIYGQQGDYRNAVTSVSLSDDGLVAAFGIPRLHFHVGSGPVTGKVKVLGYLDASR